jgi:hypothetical protein
LVAAACPYCKVLLRSGVNIPKQEGTAAVLVRLADVSDLLLRSVRGTDRPA